MRGMNLNSLINIVKIFSKSHATELLVGIGIAGMSAATIVAVKATPVAMDNIDEAIDSVNNDLLFIAERDNQPTCELITRLTPMDNIKVCWKVYAPAAIMMLTSAACIIGGTKISLKRNAALLTMYKLSETTVKELQEYKSRVIQNIDPEKHIEIEESIDRDRIASESVNMDSTIVSGHGPILYFDKMGGQWFRSDKETIREAINTLNHEMNNNMYVSLNDFYDELGMPHTIAGSTLGWKIDNGLIEPRFSAQVTQSGAPVVVVSTRLEPNTDYSKLY